MGIGNTFSKGVHWPSATQDGQLCGALSSLRLCTEVLEPAGNASHKNTKQGHCSSACLVTNDVELNKLLAGVTVMEGGVMPMHPGLPYTHEDETA